VAELTGLIITLAAGILEMFHADLGCLELRADEFH
jgi:hypothetical protein